MSNQPLQSGQLEEAAKKALSRYMDNTAHPVRDGGDAQVWRCIAWAMADDLKIALDVISNEPPKGLRFPQ